MSEALPIHATFVAIGGRGVLLSGASGGGKSDLALRLIDRGAALVSDDYTMLAREGGRLLGSPPSRIAGKLEVRGIGIVDHPFIDAAPVCLLVDLSATVERMPAPAQMREIAGIAVPVVALAALEASAPVKVEWALKLFGLKP